MTRTRLEKLAQEHSGRHDYVPETMLTPNTMRDRILRRESDFIAGFRACRELAARELKGFNPGCGCCMGSEEKFAEEILATLPDDPAEGES